MTSSYIKPKAEYAAAKKAKWQATAPAGSDPTDIDAIAMAFTSGAIREQYANDLVANSAKRELPDAVAALKHTALLDTLAGLSEQPAQRKQSAPQSNGWDPEITKTFSPAALDRMRGGPPKTEMSEREVDAWMADLRAARAARRRH